MVALFVWSLKRFFQPTEGSLPGELDAEESGAILRVAMIRTHAMVRPFPNIQGWGYFFYIAVSSVGDVSEVRIKHWFFESW